MRRIQGKRYNGNIRNQKISLSNFNDERFVLDNRIHTLPYFHKGFKNRCWQMIINKKGFKKILTNGYK